MPLDRKIRYGMVGGGPDAFIGAVHRKAAALDGEIDLVAGAFSSSPEKSRQQGRELFLDVNRVYGSYHEMAEKESQLPEGERIDFVSIVTPNHVHFDVAKTFIEAGFHVVCDKPMTTTVADAEALCNLVKKHDVCLRAHTQLHRLPDGKASTPTRERRETRNTPQNRCRIPARLARHISWKTKARNKLSGALIPSKQVHLLVSGTSVPTQRTWHTISQDWESKKSVQT